MWRATALLLLLLHGARGQTSETATVDGELAITSDWDGGFCGSLMTRNPGTQPSTTWAGLFTFSGGKLTTGPNGNGVAKKISDTQWTFVPDNPTQMIIYPQSTVMATFCCDAEAKEDVKVTFRVIYSGVGVVDPPSPSPSPPSPSHSPTPPSPVSPPPSPASEVPAPAPVAAEDEAAESNDAASLAPAPAPESAGFVMQESLTTGTEQAGQDIALAVPEPVDAPAASSAATASSGQAWALLATTLAALAAALLA